MNAAVSSNNTDDLKEPLANLGFELDEEDLETLVKELQEVEDTKERPCTCGDLLNCLCRKLLYDLRNFITRKLLLCDLHNVITHT